jgi:hypothetical protein
MINGSRQLMSQQMCPSTYICTCRWFSLLFVLVLHILYVYAGSFLFILVYITVLAGSFLFVLV